MHEGRFIILTKDGTPSVSVYSGTWRYIAFMQRLHCKFCTFLYEYSQFIRAHKANHVYATFNLHR